MIYIKKDVANKQGLFIPNMVRYYKSFGIDVKIITEEETNRRGNKRLCFMCEQYKDSSEFDRGTRKNKNNNRVYTRYKTRCKPCFKIYQELQKKHSSTTLQRYRIRNGELVILSWDEHKQYIKRGGFKYKSVPRNKV